MSYDLAIYVAEELSPAELAELVRVSPGLERLDGPATLGGESVHLRVGQGARRTYGFTVEGPIAVEPQDVPEEITAVALGIKYLFQVFVEGTADASVPHAIRFARRLSKQLSGAVLDLQTGEVWPKKSLRTRPSPVSPVKTDIVEICWYIDADKRPQGLAERFLRLARRNLPEALPRQFGVREPFQGRLDRDGDQGFVDMCEAAPGDTNFMVGTYPVGLGYIDGAGRKRPMSMVSMTVDRAALTTEPWRQALRRLFIEFSIESRSAFARAEVLRNYVWKSRWFNSSKESESAIDPCYIGQWTGLSTYPQWWTWYGPDYVELVTPYLHGQAEVHPDGLFHSGQTSRWAVMSS
ncbi:hypothetical protein [Arthrobacter sp. B2a2-09]|uniref:hypothetical protein n=1 Tax=Arthrobacter sp. B2a2-09 TaxID=2952822 RepID=UPI0022CDA4BE|nr:hypothetical protein [Arthrobacter sp. B2a2-09]MCZ9881859.1 hypothetical protein [Arthrobacter sp. B2a2-09]